MLVADNMLYAEAGGTKLSREDNGPMTGLTGIR